MDYTKHLVRLKVATGDPAQLALIRADLRKTNELLALAQLAISEADIITRKAILADQMALSDRLTVEMAVVETPEPCPPARGEQILAWVLPLGRAEAVLGDLEEQFRRRLARGVSEKEAVRWYYWHVARSSGDFLFQKARWFGIGFWLLKLSRLL
jgi:hypothetical protein